MRVRDIIDGLCEVDYSKRGFLKRLGTMAGGLAMSPAMVASATSPELLVVEPAETWIYGHPTGLPHEDTWINSSYEVFDLATQTRPLTGNVAKFFTDKGYGFTASGQLVLTPEKAKRVSQLADILAGRHLDQSTLNALNSLPLDVRYDHPLLQQIYAEQTKAYKELASLNKSTLSSYKQVFGKEMAHTPETIARSQAEEKRMYDAIKKYKEAKEARERRDAEKKKEQDSLKYSRMDYAGGSEDTGYSLASESFHTSRILGESDVDDLSQHFKDALDLIVQYKNDLEEEMKWDDAFATKLEFAALRDRLESYIGKYGTDPVADHTLWITNRVHTLPKLRRSANPMFMLKMELSDFLESLISGIKSGEIPVRDPVSDILGGDPFRENTTLSPEVMDHVASLLRPHITTQDINDIYAERI